MGVSGIGSLDARRKVQFAAWLVTPLLKWGDEAVGHEHDLACHAPLFE
jgi:hypothetical protein